MCLLASDIRQLEHIEYTPAPDIIHEGAGHAPIIANPEYAEYLRRFGDRLQSNFFAQLRNV
jgi:phenylalanine-4-hydroxylase